MQTQKMIDKLKASMEKRKKVIEKLIEAVETKVADKLSPKLEYHQDLKLVQK